MTATGSDSSKGNESVRFKGSDEKWLDEILFSLTDQSAWDLIGVSQQQYNELSNQLEVDRDEAKQAILSAIESREQAIYDRIDKELSMLDD